MKQIIPLPLLFLTIFATAQNTGIGTTSPLTKLHIVNGISGALPLNNALLAVENNGPAYISLLSPDFNEAGLIFGLPSYIAHGGIIYNNISTPYGLQFRTNVNFTRMVIDNAGNVGIGTISPTKRLEVAAGDASLALFGPNLSGGMLYIGASTNQATALAAQVISTNGNLHIDPAPSKNIYLGYYQARDMYINPNGGFVGIGTTSPSTTFEVNGYSKLGNDAPAVKFKKLTGTTAPVEGASVLIPHGLNNLKIISVSVIVLNASSEWVGHNSQLGGNNFTWKSTGTNIEVFNIFGSSAAILSKSIRILITYEE